MRLIANSKHYLVRTLSVVLFAIGAISGLVLGSHPAMAVYTNLYSFAGAPGDGSNPVGALVQAPGQNIFYGTTRNGGKAGLGIVFKWDQTTATETVLHVFTGVGGSNPTGTLIIKQKAGAAVGVLYGTTLEGGAAGKGIVWSMDTNGAVFKILHQFTGLPDGANPWAGVILDTNGYLYGTTVRGGQAALGTVYRLRPNGTLYGIIHNFTGSPDGAYPFARLFEVNADLLAGTTFEGGAFPTGAPSNEGTVYLIGDLGAPYNILHSFTGTLIAGVPPDGAYPTSEVIDVPNPNGPILHGTTTAGGVFGDGTVYRIQPVVAGAYFDCYDFKGGPGDGADPWGALVYVPATGFIYGNSRSGGPLNDGVIYVLNPAVGPPYPEGLKYIFQGSTFVPPDGSDPYDALVQSTVDGLLYANTFNDGSGFDGILFNQTP